MGRVTTPLQPAHPLRRAIAPAMPRSGWTAAGALALLCSTVAWASLPRAHQAARDGDHQWQALGVAPLAGGGATGLAMAPTQAAEPVEFVPRRAATLPPPEPRPAALPPPSGPVRIRGRISDGLYWSLRAAGASPQAAAQYLMALASEIDVGEVGQGEGFDLVLGKDGTLLYAGLDRFAGIDLQLVRWSAGGRPTWVNAARAERPQPQEEGMAWPVAGRITSSFGYRVHPILRFARFHAGVDFGAGWGAPIVAAADGQVVRAGWAGGYGRQVRIAHGGGVVTSYSHMSEIAAAPGQFVRRGQLIGYVGSSGLSTGPHLHYEVIRDGVAVNPLAVRFASAPPVDTRTAAAVKARLRALLSLGSRSG